MTLKGSGLGGLGNSVTIGVADCQHPSNEGFYWQAAHRDAGFDYSDLHWFPLYSDQQTNQPSCCVCCYHPH